MSTRASVSSDLYRAAVHVIERQRESRALKRLERADFEERYQLGDWQSSGLVDPASERAVLCRRWTKAGAP